MAKIWNAVKWFWGRLRGNGRGTPVNVNGNIVSYGTLIIFQCSNTEIVNGEEKDPGEEQTQ